MKRLVGAFALGALAIGLVACGSDDSTDEPAATATSTATPAATRAVALDTAFGSSGIATIPLSPNTHDRFMAVAVGPDGKSYAAGFIIDAGDQAMAVARIDTTGKLDPTFGTGGIASVNVAVGGKTAELARAVAIQSSGKIIIGGPFEKDPTGAGDAARDLDVAVARFDTTGKLDTTFGTGGIAKVDFGTGRATSATAFGADTAWGIGSLAGDKIAIFGSKLADGADRTDTDFVVAGLTAAGQLDTAFGANGMVVVDGGDKSADNPRHLLVQADGKIVTSGYSNLNGVVQPVLLRLSAAGVLDSAFGANGKATAQVLPGVAEAYNVSQQGTDYIVAGYGRGADATEKVDLIVYRFKANGTIDSAFGTSGLVRIDIAREDDRARNVTVLPDGSILAVGSGKRTALDIDAMMVLLNKDGARVSSFGENGILITDLGGPADAWFGVAVAPDKKSVIVTGYKGTEGSGNDDAVIARILL